MTNLYCSRGHQNPDGSRFCLQCGEKLDTAMISGVQPGKTLGDGGTPSIADRYVIVRQLGQGGFGRTYLAEDSNRFRELCVLKEFFPQVQTPYVVQKAEELFQREASVLYKLQHPQIPRFREMLRVNLEGKEYLFLVQDYVEGQTYNSLLNARKQQGLRFTEIEVRQLLQQILPILEYIHSLGVIHRDISPDNLILRNSDQLPVLIDFGGVKQVVAAVASQYYQSGEAASSGGTLLGKIGFAPPEQMQSGMVYPHSDLYALAVTMLVLLTGKQPQELLDTYNLTWQWRREVSLSPNLGQIIDRMLAPAVGDRYQSARQVLEALNPSPPISYPQTQPPANYPQTQPPTPAPVPTAGTVAVSPPVAPQLPQRTSSPTPQNKNIPSPPSPPSPTGWTPITVFFVTLGLTSAVALGWWALSGKKPADIGQVTPTSSPTASIDPQPVDPLAQYSPEERRRKEKLKARRQQLGIDFNFYVSLVNQVFWEQNPRLRGKRLSDSAEDESSRAKWDQVAAELLEKLSTLSDSSRRKLGSYTNADRDKWKVEVNQINVGSRSLYDLGDAAFYHEFPEQQGRNFLNQPIGQVWYGFVNDKLNAILAKSILERIVFDTGATGKTVSGTLQPGGGKVFIAGLAQDQNMEVKLEANSQVLFSIYSPSGKIKFLEDSQKRTLSTKLPENGFYEFVVISTASAPVDYQLSVTAESPEPEPTPTETPTEEPTTEPTETPTETPTEEPTPTETPQEPVN
ncbi:MAG TPA: serine/threonine-protein kinase [Nostocaceae cyanobacterium]|nr:serine/threonine-protein kinase [Nostocaceae cyanobacterium]